MVERTWPVHQAQNEGREIIPALNNVKGAGASQLYPAQFERSPGKVMEPSGWD
jgi:hypothetical protein